MISIVNTLQTRIRILAPKLVYMQLIILGMHRSGTSVLARLLNMMGAYFGPEGSSTGANHENPKGFWERRDVRNLSDYVLLNSNADWNKVGMFNPKSISSSILTKFRNQSSKIVLEMDAHRPWLLKEPRLCLLFNLWKDVLEVPICIHIFRNPLEVAKSLQIRNGIPIHAGIALWEKYNLTALEGSRDQPRFIVSHSKLMTDPVSEVRSIYDQLKQFSVDDLRIPSEKEILAFINKDLYRQKVSRSQVSQFLNSTQAKLFEEFENGTILEKKNKFNPSKGGIEVLKQFDLSEQNTQDEKRHVENQQKDFEQQIEKTSQLNEKVSQQNEKISQLNGKNQGLEEANKGLEEANKGLEEANKGLEEANKGLEEANKGLEEANKGLEEANKGLEEANKELQLRILASESRLQQTRLESLEYKEKVTSELHIKDHRILASESRLQQTRLESLEYKGKVTSELHIKDHRILEFQNKIMSQELELQTVRKETDVKIRNYKKRIEAKQQVLNEKRNTIKVMKIKNRIRKAFGLKVNGLIQIKKKA